MMAVLVMRVDDESSVERELTSPRRDIVIGVELLDTCHDGMSATLERLGIFPHCLTS